MWCVGQFETGAQLWRPPAWSCTSTASDPQGRLSNGRLQPIRAVCSRVVTDHSPRTGGDEHVARDGSVRYVVEAVYNVLPQTQLVHLGHGQHYHWRSSALRRVRAEVAGARGLGRRTVPRRRRSAPVTSTDRQRTRRSRRLNSSSFPAHCHCRRFNCRTLRLLSV